MEKEIDKAIENDLIYTPSPPTPPEDATWEEIKRNEVVFVFIVQDFT